MVKEYLLAEHTIDGEDLEDLRNWLETDPWLTQGPLVKEFESKWSQWLGVQYSIFVNSGSSANLLMYYSLLLSGDLKNNKVVVPAVSWATTVAPAIQLGFEPIMCDAALGDFGLDLDCLERLLSVHHPSMVVIVPVLGVPNEMDKLLQLKQKYNFVLLEDTCAATGSQYDGTLLGNFGEMSSFSFYYGHHLSTIEGGMVCTNDPKLRDILLQIRSHGWAKNLDSETERLQSQAHGIIDFNRPFTFYYPGFNVRSTDLNARIGLSQLRKIDYVVNRRVENHQVYQERLLDGSDLHFQTQDRSVICSISFAALAESQDHRDRIAQALKSENIETRPLGGGNMSRQPFWLSNYDSQDFQVADRIHTTGFQLPNNPSLTVEDIHHICDVVINVR